MPADRYVSPTGPSRHEVEIKRSRFIACILPVVDDAQARDQLSELRREFHDARHCCSAYLLGAGRDSAHSSDDGEPAGTAGVPIMQALSHHVTTTGQADLSNVLAAVVRYFGGIKLGAGGLARAYGGVVSQALQLAPMLLHERRSLLDAHLPPSDAGRFEAVLRTSGLDVLETNWDDPSSPAVRIACPAGTVEETVRRIASLTSGAARTEPAGQRWVSRPLPVPSSAPGTV
ncbi:IMPACT family protein [Propionibacterium australiense]|uniref:Ribosomal protein S5 domain 2-type fold n=1 Tax=Propionibacterium australiense TaxID=119981 RepID=A0A383S6Q2_9ACTN|nr:YigZ family protein [Propionibacterium australiense]RLP08551.1 YigZ family protein [Propionibacterium australiense]RLP08618.1 YigZ family protein [Propionibacterium australiense]SYZ33597.1 Ribosomal protein S5 domain 2-type fold [Propionibacterium australiense]VEH88790.1 IMPACT family member yigZ [Propionibacterium australiense]